MIRFNFPDCYLNLLEFSCKFVSKSSNDAYRAESKQSGTFSDLFSVVLMTQCKSEPNIDQDKESLFDLLTDFYDEQVLVISEFAIRFSEAIETDFIWIYNLRQKVRKLEKFFNRDFESFIGVFGNSVEFFNFIKNFMGMERIICQSDILYLLGIFAAEQTIPDELRRIFKKIGIIENYYDFDSAKFFIHSIAKKIDLHPKAVMVILHLNRTEWMAEIRKKVDYGRFDP